MPYLKQDLTVLDLGIDAVAWTNFCASIPNDKFSIKGANKILRDRYHAVFSTSHFQRILKFDKPEDLMYFVLVWA